MLFFFVTTWRHYKGRPGNNMIIRENREHTQIKTSNSHHKKITLVSRMELLRETIGLINLRNHFSCGFSCDITPSYTIMNCKNLKCDMVFLIANMKTRLLETNASAGRRLDVNIFLWRQNSNFNRFFIPDEDLHKCRSKYCKISNLWMRPLILKYQNWKLKEKIYILVKNDLRKKQNI